MVARSTRAGDALDSGVFFAEEYAVCILPKPVPSIIGARLVSEVPMKSRWREFVLYASLLIIGGGLLYLLVGAQIADFESKSLWDWLDLLLTPLFLAGSALVLGSLYRANEREKEEKRARFERELAISHQQEAALETYLGQMTDLLLNEKLRTTKTKEVRTVARARTLEILQRLDGMRRGNVVRFLYEAELINTENPVISLDRANLQYAELPGANLQNAELQGVHLEGANLRHARLEGANLRGAYLEGAHLRGAYFQRANMQEAHLRGAHINGITLEGTNLERATMPNGRKNT